MDVIAKLTEERDEARRIVVAMLIADIVVAHYQHDIRTILLGTEALADCPYPEAAGVLGVGLAVGNFVAGCAYVHAMPAPKTQDFTSRTRACA